MANSPINRLPAHREHGVVFGVVPVTHGNDYSGKHNCDKQRSDQRTIRNAIRIHSDRLRTYDIYLTRNTFDATYDLLAEVIGARAVLLITTPTVARLYVSEMLEQLKNRNSDIEMLILNCTEATKSIDQVRRVCKRASSIGIDRQGLLIALGGGVCTDIVTVAASWIRRGIDYVRVPTTLIGQVDASIGIKGAVNFCQKKSYVGCFYAPTAVVITPRFLQTVPHSHLRSGLAEIVKIAIVRDRRLFELVEGNAQDLILSGFQDPREVVEDVIWRAITRMLEELEPNIYEDQTYQRLVDFGHTFSPALESASNFTIPHGEAVAIDIALSATLANQLGILHSSMSSQIISVLLGVGLPIWSPFLTLELCRLAVQEATQHRGGQLNMVVPTGIGEARFLERTDDLRDSLLEGAIRALMKAAQVHQGV